MKTFEELRQDVLFWANERNLLHSENAPRQFMKFIEETGELSQAILKSEDEKITDAFGDVFVTLIVLAEQLNYHPVRCLHFAYEEIKNREGQTIDGVFVKKE